MKWFFAACLIELSALGRSQTPAAKTDLPFVPGKRWAFIVGASTYPSLGNLTYAASDAIRFRQKLVDSFRFEPGRIVSLIEGEAVAPSSVNIKSKLDEVLASRSLDQGDLFVLYFSGHGFGTATGDYLAPSDATLQNIEQTGVPVRDLVGRLVKAGLKNVLIIADCCRAGKKNEFGAELQQLGKRANIAVLLGCQPGRRSYEYPSLQSGAFAYFLLRAMSDPSLRDPASGALWASKVAAQAERQVFNYTERDYGDAAQKPQPWTEPTQDVLLGAYVPQGSASLAIQAFRSEAEKLDPNRYHAALAGFAEELYVNSKYLECIELYKTLEGLSANPPSGRINLGQSLGEVGRYAEGTRQILDVIAKEKNPYYKNLAMLVSDSRAISATERTTAAKYMFEADPLEVTAFNAVLSVKTTGSYAEQLSFLAYLAKKPFSSRFLAALRAERAMVEGQWSIAIKEFNLALKTAGEFPSEDFVQKRMMLLYLTIDASEELFAFAGEALKTSSTPYLWHLTRGRLLKDAGQREAAVAEIKLAFPSMPADEGLLTALKITGADSPLIADDVIAVAEKNPFAWKAQLARVIAASLKGGPQAGLEFSDETEKYADDELSVVYSGFDTVYAMLRDAFEIGRVPGDKFAQLLLLYSRQLLDLSPRFRYDRDVWWLALELGLNAERNVQIAQAYRRYLEPPLLAGKLTPDLLAAYCFAMLAVGDEASAKKALSLKGFGSTDLNDGKWIYASYLASQDRLAEAKQLMKPLAPPSLALVPVVDGVRAYVNGDLKAAAKLDMKHPVAMAFKGLTLARAGQAKAAEPLLEPSRTQRAWGYYFVHARAVAELQKLYMKSNRAKSWRVVAYETALGQPGNRLYESISYLGRPNQQAFAGNYSFKLGGVEDDLVTPQSGTLSFSVTPKGVLSGRATVGETNTAIPIKGRVDANGNLYATGGGYTIHAKIAPTKVAKESKAIFTNGQLFFFYRANGLRTTLLTQ